jgi:hypothetical protein
MSCEVPARRRPKHSTSHRLHPLAPLNESIQYSTDLYMEFIKCVILVLLCKIYINNYFFRVPLHQGSLKILFK